MSQYYFNLDENLSALVGYDRPLEYHFLVIEDPREDEPIFSNLFLDNPAMTVRQIKRVLKNKFQSVLPYEIETLLIADRSAHVEDLMAGKVKKQKLLVEQSSTFEFSVTLRGESFNCDKDFDINALTTADVLFLKAWNLYHQNKEYYQTLEDSHVARRLEAALTFDGVQPVEYDCNMIDLVCYFKQGVYEDRFLVANTSEHMSRIKLFAKIGNTGLVLARAIFQKITEMAECEYEMLAGTKHYEDEELRVQPSFSAFLEHLKGCTPLAELTNEEAKEIFLFLSANDFLFSQ